MKMETFETGDLRFIFDNPRFSTPPMIRVIDDVVYDRDGYTIKGHWEKVVVTKSEWEGTT